MGGHDKLSIISLNSSKKGLCSMSPERSARYLDNILNGASPDICFLPGDDKAVKYSGTVTGYQHYQTPSDTVLLYSATKVKMQSPDVNFCSFGHFPGLNIDNLVCPHVEIIGPHQNIVKQFNLITWQHMMYQQAYQEAGVVAKTLTENLIRFSMRFAQTTQQGVLISGEIPLPSNTVHTIVKHTSKDYQTQFLEEVHSDLEDHSFLPSMTKGATRDLRHLFMMNVFRCQSQTSNGIVREYQQPEADCFIASKTLELTEASLVDVGDVIGRQVNVRPCEVEKSETPTRTTTRPDYYCPAPTQTTMTIPPRPPRHHGG